jgi:hypothetical protein
LAASVGVSSGVYRSEAGTIWRVSESDEGALKVEVLSEGAWVQGSLAMVGLRLHRATRRLSDEAIRKLPD